MKKKKILLVTWVALILGGTILISYFRQEVFEQQIESKVTEFQRRMETDSQRLAVNIIILHLTLTPYVLLTLEGKDHTYL
jgi:hypothetical protein